MAKSGKNPEEGSARFINRDLSWLDFNARVLAEGLRKDLPPLDRFRFICIVSSNLDEFYMVRFAAMRRALRMGVGAAADPAGLSPDGQIRAATEKVRAITGEQYRCLKEELFPAMAAGGLELVRPENWSIADMDFLENWFLREVFPVLTPLRLSPKNGEDEESLAVSSLEIHAAFLLEREEEDAAGPAAPEDGPLISLLKIPAALSRIVRLPNEERLPDGEAAGTPAPEGASAKPFRWALLEDVILCWGAYFFPGFRVKESVLFKINRDADFSVDEQRDEDFVEAMEEVLERRAGARAVRMVCAGDSPRLLETLQRHFGLSPDDVFQVESPMHLPALASLADTPGFDQLRRPNRRVYENPAFPSEDENFWDRIRAGDLMLHLPYQSFDPVLRFFREAAEDPQVIAIKTALYRTSGDSPIIRALEQAALNGKHVTAFVELKARFDEARNIAWANRLEKAGVIVVYGLAHLKVHAKVSLVIRREEGGLARYVHLSTGNYNDRTAKLYGDIGIFTAGEDIAFDAGLLFNMITGWSSIRSMRTLAAAPFALKRRLLELIGREAARSSRETPGRIIAKMNSLADPDIIGALYAASRAGVKISLNVRGICMLIPGVRGMSESIEVLSIVDRSLEHARIFFFANHGAPEIYLSSADWMPRNLDRRVELMFPVLRDDLRAELREILEAYFRDNTQSWALGPDSRWTRRSPATDEPEFSAQEFLLRRAAEEAESRRAARTDFVIRRRKPAARR